MKDDPTIARIRMARHKISATHQHDPAQLIRYYMQLQKQYEDRLIKAPAPAPTATEERRKN